MEAAVGFYTDLGFNIIYGDAAAPFVSLSIGSNFVNLQRTGEPPGTGWGRVVFHVESPDDVHDIAVAAGHDPSSPHRMLPGASASTSETLTVTNSALPDASGDERLTVDRRASPSAATSSSFRR